MTIKEQTIMLLNHLKKLKIYRRNIEKDLGYSVKYIDQELSRGSNPTLLKELTRYHQSIIDKMADPLPKILTILEDMNAKVDVIYELEIQRYAKEHEITEDAAREEYEKRKIEKLKKK